MSKPNVNATARDERGTDRLEVEIAAGLRSQGGRRLPVLIRNISVDGFMVEGGQTLAPGLPVTLELFDGRKLPARVVWKREGHIGAAFETPLDLGLLASID